MQPLWIFMVSHTDEICVKWCDLWLQLFINLCALTVQTMMTVNTLLNVKIWMNLAWAASCWTKDSMMGTASEGDLAELVLWCLTVIISYHCYARVICEMQEENAAAKEIRQKWSKMTQICTYWCSHTEQTLFLTCCRTWRWIH